MGIHQGELLGTRAVRSVGGRTGLEQERTRQILLEAVKLDSPHSYCHEAGELDHSPSVHTLSGGTMTQDKETLSCYKDFPEKDRGGNLSHQRSSNWGNEAPWPWRKRSRSPTPESLLFCSVVLLSGYFLLPERQGIQIYLFLKRWIFWVCWRKTIFKSEKNKKQEKQAFRKIFFKKKLNEVGR